MKKISIIQAICDKNQVLKNYNTYNTKASTTENFLNRLINISRRSESKKYITSMDKSNFN